MPETFLIRCDGRSIQAQTGHSVASALLNAGITVFRQSVNGQPRGPLCGMGVCMECRVTINGTTHQLACQTLCRDGMEINTR